jgi:hypothetical protein
MAFTVPKTCDTVHFSTIQEFERIQCVPEPKLQLTESKSLAALCILASGFPKASAVEADTGRELYEKWKANGTQGSDPARKEGLKRQMVHFLGSVLPRYDITFADARK